MAFDRLRRPPAFLLTSSSLPNTGWERPNRLTFLIVRAAVRMVFRVAREGNCLDGLMAGFV